MSHHLRIMPSPCSSLEMDAFSISRDIQHTIEEVNISRNEFYVEGEVIFMNDENDFLLQQMTATDKSYSYDDCFNLYCKTFFTNTNECNATKQTEQTQANDTSFLLQDNNEDSDERSVEDLWSTDLHSSGQSIRPPQRDNGIQSLSSYDVS